MGQKGRGLGIGSPAGGRRGKGRGRSVGGTRPAGKNRYRGGGKGVFSGAGKRRRSRGWLF